MLAPIARMLGPMCGGACAMLRPIAHALSPFAVSFWTGAALLLPCVLLGSHRVLRWPLLLVAAAHVAVELVAVAVLVAVVGLWDEVVSRWRAPSAKASLLGQLRVAETWDQYLAAARCLDAVSADA